MSFLNSFVNLFGTKSGRDLKKLTPLVSKINKAFIQLEDITHDDLRAKTQSFKDLILKEISEKDNS